MKLTSIISLATCALILGGAAPRAECGVTLTTLVSFNNTNGANPYAAMLQGEDGDLFGTTAGGGANGRGTVFRMTPSGTLTGLVSFNRTNGADPFARLTQGVNGKLYGTTYAGGETSYGTVFSLTTNGTLTTLVSFKGTNGIYPKAGLLAAPDGNFYGTTAIGGTNSAGTVFIMTTNGVLTTLASFDPQGASPYAGLVQGADGCLYGTTFQGGTSGHGTVFKLTTNGAFTTLYSFTGGDDGAHPYAQLVQGADGSLYGTTSSGGAYTNASNPGYGTAFKLTTNGAFSALVSFGGTNGAYPQAGLVQSANGNFYGTTYAGGAFTNESSSGDGTVFKLTATGTLTTLVSFNGTNGANPSADLALGADGNFYGTTVNGGLNNYGTVFRLTFPQPPEFQTVTSSESTLTLIWRATVGESYQMLYKTNLGQADWKPLGTAIIATNATMTTLDVIGQDQQRFYRVVVVPY